MKDYIKSFFLLELFQSTYVGTIIHSRNIDFDILLQFNTEIFNYNFIELEAKLTLPSSVRRPLRKLKKHCIRLKIEESEKSKKVNM